MIYVVAQQHPTRPEVSMFTTENKADADQYRAIGWTVLEIEAQPARTRPVKQTADAWENISKDMHGDTIEGAKL